MKRIYPVLLSITIVFLFLTVTPLASDGQTNIAASASVSAPECNPRDSISAINDGVIPDASFGGTAGKYSSHNFKDGFDNVSDYDSVCDNYETITFTWDTEVTIDSLAVFFACSAPDREPWLMFGGEDVPASYTVEYLINGEYAPVPSPIGLGCERDTMNVTSFEKVTTSSIRIVMTKLTEEELNEYVYKKVIESGRNLSAGLILNSHGIGIYEIGIYSAEETADTITDTTVPEETTDTPEVTTVLDETTDALEVTTVPEETTDTHEITTVPEETTDTPEVTTVPKDTMDAPEDTTVPKDTMDAPEDTTVPEDTTDAPEVTTVPDETTVAPEVTTVPEDTTDAPEVTTVPEETTDAPEVTTVPEEVTDEINTERTTDTKATTSVYINEGSAFDTPPSTSQNKVITAIAASVTAIMVIICGAVLIIKK